MKLQKKKPDQLLKVNQKERAEKKQGKFRIVLDQIAGMKQNDDQNIDVHIMPDTVEGSDYPSVKKRLVGNMALSIWDVGKSILVLLLATLMAYVFYALGFTEPNIIKIGRASCRERV